MSSTGVAATGGADDASFPASKAVILIGGPNQQGNHFRPLSLDLPKPLFQLAGREMLYFHVEACARVPNLQEILMIGSYDEGLFSRFFDSVWRRFNVPIRYLREQKALGTAGGIRFFRDEILEGNPASLFVLHCDVCCAFPLNEMMHFHLKNEGSCTVLGKRVFHDEAKKYGCLVADPMTKEILHWAEKPETFVSDIINCGVYLFDVSLMDTIVSVGDKISRQRLRSESSSEANTQHDLKKLFPEFSNLDNLRLEQDVLLPLADQHCLYLYELGDFWCQIKTPGMAITCSELYMQRFRFTNPSALSTTGGKLSPIIEGNVVVDSSANVHPTAKLGPNVTIAAGVTIGPGARVAHSIILEGVTIKDHACVLFSVIGWNSIIGQWARVEGQPPNASQTQVHSAETALVRDVTIFGVSVVANPEVIIRNCIVLPHKTLTQSYHDEILL
ncbi:Mannose-1-phosphate guanyltransferase alpha [Phytophthora rubi]|uniref:Mannose-1-phosphate guanyltransferase alpha n=1 Tax=Phytophthora rubi TaxID=129364 RepID=A0A6A3NHR8_9STRA|nr:Mannose-1-phosphate guanyltransferase alpha [Phytophthora rubi]KAE9051433.1 Mannose-1-phosphate guanyltransferase alpha [Phytophthora rubi]